MALNPLDRFLAALLRVVAENVVTDRRTDGLTDHCPLDQPSLRMRAEGYTALLHVAAHAWGVYSSHFPTTYRYVILFPHTIFISIVEVHTPSLQNSIIVCHSIKFVFGHLPMETEFVQDSFRWFHVAARSTMSFCRSLFLSYLQALIS